MTTSARLKEKLAVDLNERLAYSDAKIQALEQNKLRRKAMFAQAESIVTDLEIALNKMYLTIGEFNPLEHHIACAAVPLNNKFKFIKDRGFAASGAGRNQTALDNKAHKIEAKLTEAVPSCSFDVNQFSLEIGRKGTKRVLISIRLKK